MVSIEGIGEGTNLKTLKMDKNAFFGNTLPDELFALTNLEKLDISRNGFVGTLSSMIERLTKLEILCGAYNDLSGEIPSSTGNLCRLQEVVALKENNFFGRTSCESRGSIVSEVDIFTSPHKNACRPDRIATFFLRNLHC
jgi:hypothetical protein